MSELNVGKTFGFFKCEIYSPNPKFVLKCLVALRIYCNTAKTKSDEANCIMIVLDKMKLVI